MAFSVASEADLEEKSVLSSPFLSTVRKKLQTRIWVRENPGVQEGNWHLLLNLGAQRKLERWDDHVQGLREGIRPLCFYKACMGRTGQGSGHSTSMVFLPETKWAPWPWNPNQHCSPLTAVYLTRHYSRTLSLFRVPILSSVIIFLQSPHLFPGTFYLFRAYSQSPRPLNFLQSP